MKVRSAPLDDVHQEVQSVLRMDGRRPSRFLLFLVQSAYRSYHAAMLLLLRWRGPSKPSKNIQNADSRQRAPGRAAE